MTVKWFCIYILCILAAYVWKWNQNPSELLAWKFSCLFVCFIVAVSIIFRDTLSKLSFSKSMFDWIDWCGMRRVIVGPVCGVSALWLMWGINAALCWSMSVGTSRGFAFVEFNSTAEASRWMEMKQVSYWIVPLLSPFCNGWQWLSIETSRHMVSMKNNVFISFVHSLWCSCVRLFFFFFFSLWFNWRIWCEYLVFPSGNTYSIPLSFGLSIIFILTPTTDTQTIYTSFNPIVKSGYPTPVLVYLILLFLNLQVVPFKYRI